MATEISKIVTSELLAGSRWDRADKALDKLIDTDETLGGKAQRFNDKLYRKNILWQGNRLH
jgi:hypothetical protein